MTQAHQGNPGQGAVAHPSAAPGVHSYWLMGGLGAILGAVNASAQNARLLKQGKLDSGQAVRDTLKESAGLGLSAAVGVAAGRALGLSGVAGLLGMTVVAAGAKYLWDTALDQSGSLPPVAPCCAGEPKPAAKIGKAKKS